MKIAMIGAGAVGGYFGGRLASAGNEVVFLVRGKTLEALQSGPLRAKSINGNFEVRVVATDDPAEIEAEVVLVGVKAWQIAEAADAIGKMANEDSIVIPLQNGMEAPGQLAAVLGAGRVAGGLCRIVAEATGAGEIDHYWAEPSIAFGKLERLQNAERLEQLRDAFTSAGVRCHIPRDISAAMWEKFLFITPWGSLGAVTRSPVGPLRSNAKSRERLLAALQEVTEIARAEGKPLREEALAKTMAVLDSLPPETTSSMQRDIMEGRPSELEAQTGAVVRFGEKTGVATPVHDAMYAELAPLERDARRRRKMTNDE
jgi:2-dehydropantoate 2-reductase